MARMGNLDETGWVLQRDHDLTNTALGREEAVCLSDITNIEGGNGNWLDSASSVQLQSLGKFTIRILVGVVKKEWRGNIT